MRFRVVAGKLSEHNHRIGKCHQRRDLAKVLRATRHARRSLGDEDHVGKGHSQRQRPQQRGPVLDEERHRRRHTDAQIQVFPARCRNGDKVGNRHDCGAEKNRRQLQPGSHRHPRTEREAAEEKRQGDPVHLALSHRGVPLRRGAAPLLRCRRPEIRSAPRAIR